MYALTISGRLSAITKDIYTLPISLSVHGDSLLKSMHDRLVEKCNALGSEKFITDIQVQSDQQWKMDYTASEVMPEAA